VSKNRFFKQIQFLSRKFVPKKENCIPDAMFAFKGLKSIIKLIYGHFGFSLSSIFPREKYLSFKTTDNFKKLKILLKEAR